MARTVTDGENSATDYYLYDGLGCVMALGNASFSITQTLEYDVWGSQRAGQGTSSNALKYVGQLGHVSDADTGLIYMRARYYDPDVGRFLSEDPAGHGVNWYSYAGCSPSNMVDPNGRAETLGGLVASMGVGAILGAITCMVGDLMWQVIYSYTKAGSVSINWREAGCWGLAGFVVGMGAGAASGVLGPGVTLESCTGLNMAKWMLGAAAVGGATGGLAATFYWLRGRSDMLSGYMDLLDEEVEFST